MGRSNVPSGQPAGAIGKRRFGRRSDVRARDFGALRRPNPGVCCHFAPIPDSGPSVARQNRGRIVSMPGFRPRRRSPRGVTRPPRRVYAVRDGGARGPVRRALRSWGRVCRMAVGSSLPATIRSLPPQWLQVVTSTPTKIVGSDLQQPIGWYEGRRAGVARVCGVAPRPARGGARQGRGGLCSR